MGIIFGANIGTTLTAQIIAFKVTKLTLLMIAVGFGMLFISRRDSVRQYGAMIMGLGLVFFGMSLMSGAMKPLRSYGPFLDLMISMENPLLGILVAAAFTGLVQFSSATTGVVIVMAGQGLISLNAGTPRNWPPKRRARSPVPTRFSTLPIQSSCCLSEPSSLGLSSFWCLTAATKGL